jgi:hypothetical protein
MLACDFLRVDRAVALRGVTVFFAIELSTRHVHVPGVTAHPDGAWAVQQARNHGIKAVKIPPRSCWVHVYAQRWVDQLLRPARAAHALPGPNSRFTARRACG